MPDSPNLFLVSHADGTIVVYDKEREDGVFAPQEPGAPSESNPASPVEGTASGSSMGEWDPLDSIFVTMPPWHPVAAGGVISSGGKQDKDKTAKNPVSHWKVSRKNIVGKEHSVLPVCMGILMQTMPDFVFSPDAKFVAAISEDGCLRVIDTVAEQ